MFASRALDVHAIQIRLQMQLLLADLRDPTAARLLRFLRRQRSTAGPGLPTLWDSQSRPSASFLAGVHSIFGRRLSRWGRLCQTLKKPSSKPPTNDRHTPNMLESTANDRHPQNGTSNGGIRDLGPYIVLVWVVLDGTRLSPIAYYFPYTWGSL